MRPTVTQLEYFVAVARCLSFRKAAAEQHATQPAVSAQIRKLETVLGVQLFERDRRKVLLTDAGARIVDAAAGILAALDDLAVVARGRGGTLAGTLRLGLIPTVAPHVLPRVFAAVHERYPELQLAVREGQTDTLVRQLRDGSLDLLFLAIDVELGQVEKLSLCDDAFLAALPASHPLAAGNEVPIEAFVRQNVLLLDEGHCLTEQAREVCQRSAGHRFADLRAASLVTLVQMVASGLGVTMVPEIAVADLERTPGLALRRFRAPAPSRRLGLVWRPGSARAEAFRELGALFEQRVLISAAGP